MGAETLTPFLSQSAIPYGSRPRVYQIEKNTIKGKGKGNSQVRKKGARKVNKFIPSCEIRDLEADAEHNIQPIRTADWQRAKKVK